MQTTTSKPQTTHIKHFSGFGDIKIAKGLSIRGIGIGLRALLLCFDQRISCVRDPKSHHNIPLRIKYLVCKCHNGAMCGKHEQAILSNLFLAFSFFPFFVLRPPSCNRLAYNGCRTHDAAFPKYYFKAVSCCGLLGGRSSAEQFTLSWRGAQDVRSSISFISSAINSGTVSILALNPPKQ